MTKTVQLKEVTLQNLKTIQTAKRELEMLLECEKQKESILISTICEANEIPMGQDVKVELKDSTLIFTKADDNNG